jgi:hypothetical protein
MYKNIVLLLSLWIVTLSAFAQGPPILLDKPIMLGEKKGTVRTIFKKVNNEIHDFNAFVIDADYNFSNTFATMIEVPFTFGLHGSGAALGDVALGLKYQFYRKDGMGKTFRVAAKLKNMFATGKKLETMTVGMAHNMTYIGFLAAKENLRFGIQAELGYNVVPSETHLNNLDYKLGFGIPLLEPTYPVKQINIYTEFEGVNMKKHQGKTAFGYYFAPGLQYAKGLYTFDVSYQFAIKQQLIESFQRKSSLLLSVRRIL